MKISLRACIIDLFGFLIASLPLIFVQLFVLAEVGQNLFPKALIKYNFAGEAKLVGELKKFLEHSSYVLVGLICIDALFGSIQKLLVKRYCLIPATAVTLEH